MDNSDIIGNAQELRDRIQKYAHSGPGTPGAAAKAQVCEFLRTYAGPKSSFLQQAESAHGSANHAISTLTSILESFIEYLKAGLSSGISPERKGQLDVVSDILGQANTMLEDSDLHPAAAAMLIGAALEEFLRTWVESANLSLGNAKPGLDNYCKCLRAADFISKQDAKDITSWAGWNP